MNWACGTKNLINLFFGFNDKKKVAKHTAKYLAQLIRIYMKGCLIDFIGFSLGTELVRQVLLNMEEDIGMINRMIFLGGAVDCNDMRNFLKDHPIETLNCFNGKDYVLKAGLPFFDNKIRPCGLNYLDAPFTKNFNMTDSLVK